MKGNNLKIFLVKKFVFFFVKFFLYYYFYFGRIFVDWLFLFKNFFLNYREKDKSGGLWVSL